jgi:protein-L-isoaspartate(D-aspartate) O-methyltransferase
MPDFVAQRLNMVDAQVRTNDVIDPRIHAAMVEVPRERFVPAAQRALAYADVSVEVAPTRYLLEPRAFAKLVQLADIKSSDRILDVGTATGYSAAILGKLGRTVTALEQDADLVRAAQDLLRASPNVTVVQGSLVEGSKANAPFNVILINGAVESVPESLTSQLAEGGRLVAIVQADGRPGKAHLYVREQGRVAGRPDFDAQVPPLGGFRKAVGFVF